MPIYFHWLSKWLLASLWTIKVAKKQNHLTTAKCIKIVYLERKNLEIFSTIFTAHLLQTRFNMHFQIKAKKVYALCIVMVIWILTRAWYIKSKWLKQMRFRGPLANSTTIRWNYFCLLLAQKVVLPMYVPIKVATA